jgi:hypothetical protein
MDDFLEQVASRRHSFLQTLAIALIWVAIVLLAFICVTNVFGIIGTTPEGGIRFQPLSLVFALAAGGLAFLCWRRVDYIRVEYDYTFTNGTLDVGQVLNNKRRRYLTALETKEVLRCGPVTSPSFRKVLHEPGIKKHNWFCNRDANLYFFYFIKKGIKHVCVLELNEEMVSLIRSKSYLQPGAWC